MQKKPKLRIPMAQLIHFLRCGFLLLFMNRSILAKQAVLPICNTHFQNVNDLPQQQPTAATIDKMTALLEADRNRLSRKSIADILRRQPAHIGILPDVGQSALLTLVDNGTLPVSANQTTGTIYCSLRLEACPNCLIGLSYEPPNKFFSSADIDKISNCEDTIMSGIPCFDIEFVEERAEQSMSYLATLTGASDVHSRFSPWKSPARKRYNSSASSLLVLVTMRYVQQSLGLVTFLNSFFPLSASVYDNTELVSGFPSQSIFLPNQTSIGFIESPRYPEAYPRVLIKNYTLVNEKQNGYIRLIFDDFHIHFQSELRIIDSDGMEIFNTKSEYRRPPALLSKSNTLTIVFHANDFTQLVGFRARYEFVESADWPDKPTRRNCDEYLEGYGGQVTLDKYKFLAGKYVDCIWLIGRFPALSRTYDKIYLRVEQFQMKGISLRLEVRSGPSSASERSLMLFDEQSRTQLERKQPLDGLITEDVIQPAFYVRLRGYLATTSGLSIVYTQFYRWATASCPGGDSELHCDNGKCIKSALRCDEADNCGDGSDEVCAIQDPSYHGGNSTVANVLLNVIIVVTIVAFFMFAIIFTSMLYKKRIDSRRRSAVARSLSTGSVVGMRSNGVYPGTSEFEPSIQTINDRRFYVVPQGQITVFEAPPTYDDALKHPAVPIIASPRNNCQRSRSAMSYVYFNDAYRSSRPPTPDFASTPVTPRPSSTDAGESLEPPSLPPSPPPRADSRQDEAVTSPRSSSGSTTIPSTPPNRSRSAASRHVIVDDDESWV